MALIPLIAIKKHDIFKIAQKKHVLACFRGSFLYLAVYQTSYLKGYNASLGN